MFKIKSDTIQFWIMVTGFMGLFGAFYGYNMGHFASAESVTNLSKTVDTEVKDRKEEDKEMKAEVDSLYLRMIPQREQITILHPGKSK